MRDLVETVIGRVMHAHPYFDESSPAHAGRQAPQSRELIPGGNKLAADPPDNDRLWQASRQFEALFVAQLLNGMRKSVPSSGLLGKGFADDVQTSMLDQAIADAVGKQGRLGIARSLYRQLGHEQSAQQQRVHPHINPMAAQVSAPNSDNTPVQRDIGMPRQGSMTTQGERHAH